jgi:hypothetical protein
MKKLQVLASAALFLAGCSTSPVVSDTDLTGMNTVALCHVLASSTDKQYRTRVAALLVRRGATADKCMRLVQADNAVATGIAVAAVGGAAVAVAANNGAAGITGHLPQPTVWLGTNSTDRTMP